MTDDTANWQPGAPTRRAILPSMIGGAVIPLAVYYGVRHHVSGDATALMIAGVVPVAWIACQWARQRRIDPVGMITLFGFIVGVVASELLGGSALVLKVRDSAFTAMFGMACLISLRAQRPMMFHLGKAMSTGDDKRKQAAYDELWAIPEAQRVFATLTIVWGVGMIAEAVARVLLAVSLPTGVFVAVSPALSLLWFGGLFAFTASYSRSSVAADT